MRFDSCFGELAPRSDNSVAVINIHHDELSADRVTNLFNREARGLAFTIITVRRIFTFTTRNIDKHIPAKM